MSVDIEKNGQVWTVIHNRPEARNVVDPQAGDDLVAAFMAFDHDPDAAVNGRTLSQPGLKTEPEVA